MTHISPFFVPRGKSGKKGGIGVAVKLVGYSLSIGRRRKTSPRAFPRDSPKRSLDASRRDNLPSRVDIAHMGQHLAYVFRHEIDEALK